MRQIVCFVDGDNQKGQNVSGINLLNEFDIVYVFFNSTNRTYYTEELKMTLAEKTKARVEFVKIENAANSVDLAICIALTKCCHFDSSLENIYLVISQDKHFDTIVNLLKKEFNRLIITKAACIKDAYNTLSLFRVESVSSFREIVIQQFGKVNGRILFEQLSVLFKEEEKQRNPFASIINSLKRIKRTVK
ncbi:hypothetical protein M2140_000394 [Clostridiales Family XIII bacterium PM5-7]